MAEFLLEIFGEEIPARMQKNAGAQLAQLAEGWLKEKKIEGAQVMSHVTPRRLVLVIQNLPIKQNDVSEEKKGPALGAPQQAIDGFLKANNLKSLDECELRDGGKAQYYFVNVLTPGKQMTELLAELPSHLIAQFNWPKSMRWGSFTKAWIRPIHRVMAIFDQKPLKGFISLGEGESAKIHFSAETTGHRFMAPDSFIVTSFEDYKEKCKKAFVIVDREERMTIIQEKAAALASDKGLVFQPDEGLMEEVSGLVEYPVPFLGQIDQAFMDVPMEVLTTSMRVHQKYFPLYQADGKLAPFFVIVANIVPNDKGVAIVTGNEKVLRARLSDARFFWDQDRKVTLESRRESLNNIRFHEKLGSVFLKTERIAGILSELLKSANHAHLSAIDSKKLMTAGQLSKADLLSGMVGEFPELQGVMGGYYAAHDGLGDAISIAIQDHYKPMGAADQLPRTVEGALVSLADKVDSLVGFFTAGLKPTSSKDPFALRRACLGIVRIIEAFELDFDFVALCEHVFRLYAGQGIFMLDKEKCPLDEIHAFALERMKVYLKDKGLRYDLIQATYETGHLTHLYLIFKRVTALTDFCGQAEATRLLSLFKRANNILQIEETKDKVGYKGQVNPIYLKDGFETKLHVALERASESVDVAIKKNDYVEAMQHLAHLSSPVNDFFENVMVNVEDSNVRINRLELLGQIRQTMNRIASFSCIDEK
ncbi:MAG: glycine--tRNA ligase subunit beta [Alphaproteobacteria bacterium]|nr:glycine--tRNA ligase subunit beta [Alphaproteobacteria bacterium]